MRPTNDGLHLDVAVRNIRLNLEVFGNIEGRVQVIPRCECGHRESGQSSEWRARGRDRFHTQRSARCRNLRGQYV